MALLHVQATSEPIIAPSIAKVGSEAAAGNGNPLRIAVSVSYDDGKPCKGLKDKHFAVHPMIMGPPPFDGVKIVSVTAGTLDGTYLVSVVPAGGTIYWNSGPFVFSVAVNIGRNHGLALCSMRLL